jgi:DNA-binding SARP family transcriptional activator
MTDAYALTEMRLLGGFTVVHEGRLLPLTRGQRRLLAILGLRHSSSRAQVAGLLWPDVPDARALGCLRTALWRLVPRDLVASDGEQMALGAGVRVDVDELVGLASALEEDGCSREPERLTRVAQEELLPGWYDDWVLIEREYLRQVRLHALEDLARVHLRHDKYGPALRSAIAAQRIEPLRETPHRLAVEIHLAEGNACEALSVYYAYHAMVKRELGVAPSPRMQALLTKALTLNQQQLMSEVQRPDPAVRRGA